MDVHHAGIARLLNAAVQLERARAFVDFVSCGSELRQLPKYHAAPSLLTLLHGVAAQGTPELVMQIFLHRLAHLMAVCWLAAMLGCESRRNSRVIGELDPGLQRLRQMHVQPHQKIKTSHLVMCRIGKHRVPANLPPAGLGG